MGYYIEVPENLNKASQLIRLHDAQDIGLPPDHFTDIPKGKVLVCVVQNGLFDAAGIIWCERELQDFKETRTNRPRTWLVMDLDKVCQLKPHLAPYLRGEKEWD